MAEDRFYLARLKKMELSILGIDSYFHFLFEVIESGARRKSVYCKVYIFKDRTVMFDKLIAQLWYERNVVDNALSSISKTYANPEPEEKYYLIKGTNHYDLDCVSMSDVILELTKSQAIELMKQHEIFTLE